MKGLVPVARYLELLIERDVLDAHGRPLWADEAVPRRTSPLPGVERHDAA